MASSIQSINSRRSRVAFSATCAVIVLAIAGAAGEIKVAVEHPKPLRVGYNEFSPYIVVGAGRQAGMAGGLAVDVIVEAARRSGQHLEWVKVTDGESGLRSGMIDLYPLFTVTRERVSRYHFSEYWWQNNMVLVSTQRHPIASAADTRGKRIGLRTSGYVVQVAHALFPEAAIVRTSGIEPLWKFFCRGDLDAFFVDSRAIQSALFDLPLETGLCRGAQLKITALQGATFPQGTASTLLARNRADLLYEHIYELITDGTLATLAARYQIAAPDSNQQLTQLLHGRQHYLLVKAAAILCSILALLLWAFQQMRRARRAARETRLQLEESEERFHAFMEHSPALAYMKDDGGRMVYLNEAYSRTIGVEARYRLGKTDFEALPKRIAEQLDANDRKVLEGNTPRHFTEVVPDADGKQHTWLSFKFPFRDRAGKVFLGGVSVEISQMVAAQEELRVSETRYRQIVDFASDMIVRCDRRGRITYCNEVGARLLKVPLPTIAGRSALGFLQREDRHRLLRTLQREAADGASDIYLECPVISAGGEKLWLGQIIRILRVKDDVIGYQAISRDITERKQVEAELRESEERFRVLYENAPVAYHEIDCQGIIRRVNRAECELLGVPAEQLIGSDVVNLVLPEDRVEARQAIENKIREITPLRPFERTYQRWDGRKLRLEIHENLLRDAEQRVIGVHSALLDMTQRHQAELLDRDRRELSEMIAQLRPLEQIFVGISRMISHQSEDLECIPLQLQNGRFKPLVAEARFEALQTAITGLGAAALSIWPLADFRVTHRTLIGLGVMAGETEVPCELMEEFSRLGLKSCWAVPVESSETPSGVLLVLSTRLAEPTLHERQLLEESARLAGIAMKNRYMTDLLAFQAGHDSLTGLPNRSTFEARLQDSLLRAQSERSQLAVFYIDLDRFKTVNDTYGHVAGDGLLQLVAGRLRGCIRQSDLLARIGGDEFTLLLDGLCDPMEANRVAGAILRAFQASFDLDGTPVQITPSIGISFYPKDGTDAATLQRHSDIAMYRAKKAGKNNYRCFREEVQSRTDIRISPCLVVM